MRTIQSFTAVTIVTATETAHIARETSSLATAEIARDADDVDFSVDDAHRALTFNSFNNIIIL